jgi:hypothetical protein
MLGHSANNGPHSEEELQEDLRKEIGAIVAKLIDKKIQYSKEGRPYMAHAAGFWASTFIELYKDMLDGVLKTDDQARVKAWIQRVARTKPH